MAAPLVLHEEGTRAERVDGHAASRRMAVPCGRAVTPHRADDGATRMERADGHAASRVTAAPRPGQMRGMRRLMGMLMVAGLLAGCAGTEETGLTYAELSERTAEARCTYAETCSGSTTPHAECVAAIREYYAAAGPELDRAAAGAKSGCVQCMRTLVAELEASLASSCQRPVDEARVVAMCGENDAACVGAP
ncbi:hypothetical protein HPC49_33130 [Pyxidicoccus fallax]|uniref:Uncharacterized protein n=1 Tax=Pyxidicoccus fallax TaxID=394095 RepID=A0A848LE25_9BACT|nr:hypothetical protein [Pyxidicoccus fallax]NMO16696.1 hypothetical protein [Pyxidicoccus fallax]NPC83053.1 hypothetical protein [Pyxidicoccus fallax]